MKQDLALQSVRKPKAKKTHLTVPADAASNIRTLCGVAMKAGEYEILDGPADCQPCLRKKDNRAFISSAYFAQDAGTRLLEMSLKAAKQDRDRRPAKPKAPTAATKAKAPKGTPAARAARTAPTPEDESTLTDDELRALGIEALKRVGLDVYQSPLGVLVRLHRDGRVWRIAEVTFEGPSSLTARASGRNSYVIGDVRLEGANGALRLKLTSRRP